MPCNPSKFFFAFYALTLVLDSFQL